VLITFLFFDECYFSCLAEKEGLNKNGMEGKHHPVTKM